MKKAILIIFALVHSLLPPSMALGAAWGYRPGYTVQTAASRAGDPLGVIGEFYSMGLLFGGVLAFGAIVWGAIKYTLSAGNPSQQGDAKEWITQALLGLALLAGAFLILRTINPNLVNLSIDLPPRTPR